MNMGLVFMSACFPLNWFIFLVCWASNMCLDGLIATIFESGELYSYAMAGAGYFYFKKFEHRLNLSFVMTASWCCSWSPCMPSCELRGTKILGSVLFFGDTDFCFQRGEAEDNFGVDEVSVMVSFEVDLDESRDLLNLKWLL